MEESIELKAKFEACNVKGNNVVMQFSLDPESYGQLPNLVMLVRQNMDLLLTTNQQVLFSKDEEECEGQVEAFADEPEELDEPEVVEEDQLGLPEGSYEVDDDEPDVLDEIEEEGYEGPGEVD